MKSIRKASPIQAAETKPLKIRISKRTTPGNSPKEKIMNNLEKRVQMQSAHLNRKAHQKLSQSRYKNSLLPNRPRRHKNARVLQRKARKIYMSSSFKTKRRQSRNTSDDIITYFSTHIFKTNNASFNSMYYHASKGYLAIAFYKLLPAFLICFELNIILSFSLKQATTSSNSS